MSVMLICTLGNRDLKLSGKDIFPAREKGREIFEHFKKHYSELSYPLIRPVLDYIFEDERREKIHRIVLVATNQGEDTAPEHRSKDTIEFAKVVEKLIREDVRRKKIKGEVGDIRIVKISENPVDLGLMYDFFGKSLKGNKAFKTDDLELCYLEQTGGIPATNMALLYQCINHFKEKCHPVYISERLGFAVPLNIANKLLLDKKKNLLIHLAGAYNYASMAVHLDEVKENEKFILRLSSYAQHRLYFDTLTARSIAKKGMKEFDAAYDKKLFEDLVLELMQIESGDYKSLILELFHNMRIKYIRQEFVDFLGRMYRFQEAVPRYFIEKEFGISTDVDPKTGRQAGLDKLLEDDKNLRAFVGSQKMPRGGNIDPHRTGTPRLIALLDFLIEKKGMEKFRPISDFFKKTGDLMNIRNKSIIAHGYKGVSENIIKEHYEGDVLEDLRAVVSLVLEKSGLTVEDEPFERINTVLSERIQRL